MSLDGLPSNHVSVYIQYKNNFRTYFCDSLLTKQNTYLTNTLLVVPLFDQSGTEVDALSCRKFHHCILMMNNIEKIYYNILGKYSKYIVPDGMNK